MKTYSTTIALLLLSINIFSQTPISVIDQYKSLDGWETPMDSVKYIFDRYLQDSDSVIEQNIREIQFPSSEEIFPQIILVQLNAKNGKVEYSFINERNPYFENQLTRFLDSIIVEFHPKSNFKLNLSFAFVSDDYQCEKTTYSFVRYYLDGYKLTRDFDCYRYSEQRVNEVLEGLLRMMEYDAALYYSKVLCRWKPFNVEYNKRYELIRNNIEQQNSDN